MSYSPRLYPDIVRDLLTTLTGGTVAESLRAPAGDALVTPNLLSKRPVRRISHLQGFVGTVERPVPYRFTSADFELISTTGDDDKKDAIRFRDGGRRPLPNSDLTVNYYPVRSNPVPLNDLNVGSVVRTLMETVAFELAVTYQHLDFIYKSAFLETAEGRSLDKVVALVGVTRLASGHPVVKVRFTRRPGDTGRITVPAGTVLTDDKGSRYLTQDELTLEPGESTREVMAAGETPGTPEVEANQLNRLEILVAGIDKGFNEEASRRLSQAETDDELRRRARSAFHGVVRGTLDALKFHLMSLDEVKDVTITEEPNGVPGEVKVDVAYREDTPEARKRVQERIEQVKPAGIRVVSDAAARRRVAVRVQLTLAGTGLSGTDLGSLKTALQEKLTKALNDTPPGGTVRRARLLSLVMEDPRIIDARVFLTPEGGAEAEELTLTPGEVISVVTPIQFSEPQTEVAITTTVDVQVSAVLPVHLTPGTTQAQATEAITNAFNSHLTTRASDTPLTLDGVAAAIRDDSRFALVRADAIITVESGERFFQLTDGIGSYAPAPNERLRNQSLNVEVREGGV
ncbi:MAG TPA: baseplate J/gp47 family protein [Pyrinomonadaceae bacterium]|nr:baseplate J/gp47 family protein [Pyrinomonadaceae bacterium]